MGTKPRAEAKLGKGGESQFGSRDRMCIVKALTKDDHKSLIVLAEAYVERLLDDETLLCPIYLHFRDEKTKKCYIALRNLTPEEKAWNLKFDLKGCDDDKTLERNGELITPIRKRFYHVHRWFSCMWTRARWDYWNAKQRARELEFSFPVSQQADIVRLIQADANWLSKSGVMDYSLLFCVRRVPVSWVPALGNNVTSHSSAGVRESKHGLKRYAYQEGDETVVLVCMGIIDFLQPWTSPKKVAMCIKSCEFNKATVPPPRYGRRFAAHFASRFKADESLLPCAPGVAQEVVRCIANLNG